MRRERPERVLLLPHLSQIEPLAVQIAQISQAAGGIWAMTSGWEISPGMGLPYFCWDTLTTSSLAVSDVCTFREVRCEVVTEGASEGRTRPTESGRVVNAADRVDAEKFYAHALETLRR